MSGAVLNSKFLTGLLTSGEEDIELVSVLKEDMWSTACELAMLILSTSVTSGEEDIELVSVLKEDRHVEYSL